MPNYSNSVIYRLINKETNETLYVGSTTNYRKRMVDHKSRCNNPKATHFNYPIYQHIRNLGGWDIINHVQIEELTNCQSKIELMKREQEFIDEYKSSKNILRSYINKIKVL
jgi:hypothetical protein